MSAFADWVHEFDTPYPERGKNATNVGAVAANRYVCWYARERRAAEFLYFNAMPVDTMDYNADVALRYGVVTAAYRRHPTRASVDSYPTHELVRIVDAAVTLSSMRRDAERHLTGRPVPAVTIDGVDVEAKQEGRGKARTFARTVETHHPTNPAGLVDVLVRKVQVEYVAKIGTMAFPAYRPTGFVAADRLRAEVEAITGEVMPVTRVARVGWRGSRPVITEELAELLPVLLLLPARMRKMPNEDDVDEGAASSTTSKVRSIDEARTRRSPAGKTSKEPAAARIDRLRAELAAEDNADRAGVAS